MRGAAAVLRKQEAAAPESWRASAPGVPAPPTWSLSCRCHGSSHPDDGRLQPGAPWAGRSGWCLSNCGDRQGPCLPPGGGWSFAGDKVGASRTHLGEGAGPEGALGGLTRLQRTLSSLPGPREVREYGLLPPSGRSPGRQGPTQRGHPSWGTDGCLRQSRLPGEISLTSDMQMTPPLWQKSKN